jgi:pyrroline-5-carboxylate reductase
MAAKLLVIGGGKMGGALVSGLLAAGWAEPAALAVVEPSPQRRRELEGEHRGLVVFEQVGPGLVDDDGGAVLAVKPDLAEGTCRLLKAAGIRRVLSVAAGIPAQRLEAALGDGAVVIRSMPNTPVLVGAGVSAISGGSHAHAKDLDWAESILSAVGTVVRVPERQLDAVTGLSGCGPAYVFLMVESLIEAGVATGLARDVSTKLVVETVLGSAKLLAESGETPEKLRADITSPGGATAAGLRTLEARAVRSAFIEAVAAAAERSRQLAH